MSIQIKFPRENEDSNDPIAVGVAMILCMIVAGLPLLEFHCQASCRSLLPLSTYNMTIDSNLSQCSIPYDECRCSVLSNRSNITTTCISDVEAMAGHILPLITYALQLYLIYNLVSFTGKYSHILTDIFWAVALVVFVIIAIAAHGSSCFHFITSFILSITGFSLGYFIIHLFGRLRDKYLLRERHNTYRNQTLTTSNNENDITITITFF